MRARAALALVALALSSPGIAAAAWPMPGHDAANTNRSDVVSAQGPALRAGWPRSDLVGPVLVAPGGAVTVPAAEPRGPGGTAVLNPDGTRRRRLPVGPLRSIGLDGRLYAWGAPSGPVSAYSAAGDLLWRAAELGAGPEASNGVLRPAPDGNVYVSGEDALVALDPSGRVRWRVALSLDDDPQAVAVGPGGTVYFGRAEGASQTLVARSPDGRTLWQRPLAAAAHRVAVADDGRVIVLRGLTGPGGTDALLAFGADGTPLWSLPAGPDANGLAVGRDGTAYLVEPRGGIVRAIGPDGAVRWTHRGRLANRDPLVGGDGTVYVGGSPLTALRPDGSRAWTFPPTGRPLVPEAIGADGTLFATWGPNLAGSSMLALAGPSARVRIRPPSPSRQRALVAQAGVRPARLRMTGPVSVCPAPGRGCRPATPLGATLRFTLRRAAAVLVVIRRVGGGVVTRGSRHLRAGTTWTGLWDAAGYRVLAPGRYLLTVRAAAGAARATAGPVRFTVVRG